MNKNNKMVKTLCIMALAVGVSFLSAKVTHDATTGAATYSELKASASSKSIYEFLKDDVLRDIKLIVGAGSVVLTIIGALTQNTMTLVLNNLGYILFVVFGSSMIMGLVESKGMLLTMI
jgi:hypothetical protein